MQNPRKIQAGFVAGPVFAPLVNDIHHSSHVKKRTGRARGTVDSDYIMMYTLGTAKINSRICGESGMPPLTPHHS